LRVEVPQVSESRPEAPSIRIGKIQNSFLGFALILLTCTAQAQQEVSFSVLGLFHPHELVLKQGDRQVLGIRANGTDASLVLNGEARHRSLIFRAEGDRVVASSYATQSWTAAGRGGGPVAFRLEVPGKIHRIYQGRLTLEAHNGELRAVVGMDRETAVASIVAAEMEESAPMEALKAQAVVTRSFLAAGPRHEGFEFCDTTHCQFLKSPPAAGSSVAAAVLATQGLVLEYRGKVLAALYSSRCGGQTRSLRDVGMEPGEGYPYFAERCAWCLKHPMNWQSRIGKGNAPQAGNEGQRIEAARQWGWSAVPGSDFSVSEDGDGVILKGHSVGHGVGMCQYGAEGMAAAGIGFRQILAHYYPNTQLTARP